MITDQIDDFRASEAFAKMKNPIILMNENDLKNWIEEIKYNLPTFKYVTFKYRDIPIETRPEIQSGVMHIYDSDKIL
jgi:hypothetical protein